MESRTLAAVLIVVIFASCVMGSGILMYVGNTISCGAIVPVGFSYKVVSSLEFHAWHLSDSTIKLFLNGNTEDLIVQWNVPESFSKMDAFHLNAVQPMSAPYPTASWIAANGTHVLRFQCGPSTLCYQTAATITLGQNSTKPIQAIAELVQGKEDMLLVVSSERVVLIQEYQVGLVWESGFNFGSETFMHDFPAPKLTGVFSSKYSGSGGTYYQLILAFAATDVKDVGMVLNLRMTTFGVWSVNTVTYLPSSPQSIVVYRNAVTQGLIFAWLVQTPYVDSVTPNAFVLSTGGAQEIIPYASAIFPENYTWSSSVFMLDGVSLTGLLICGNDSSPGFDAWSPTFGFGLSTPEVNLRTPSPLGQSLGYAKPSNGVRMYQGISLLYLSLVLSHNLHTDCYDTLTLDWAGAQKRSAQSPPILDPHHDPHATSSLLPQISPLHLNTSSTTFSGFGNCRPSNCNFETAGDCPVTNCWGHSNNGGFACCKHPPVF